MGFTVTVTVQYSTVNRVVRQIRALKPSFIAENTAPTSHVKFEGPGMWCWNDHPDL